MARKNTLSLFTFGLLLTMLVPFAMMDAHAAGSLYGLDGRNGAASILHSIDTSTGVATPVGPSGFSGCGAMDYDTVGNEMYAICGNGNPGPPQLITVDLGNGVGTLVATITGDIPGNAADMSFHSDNTLFVQEGRGAGNELFTVDKVTGFATLVGPAPDSWGHGIAFSPSDILFHSTGFGDPGTGLDTLNILTAVASPKTLYTFVGFPSGVNFRANVMDFMPGSNTIFASIPTETLGLDYLATIDPNTAVVIHIGATSPALDALAFLPDVAIGGIFVPIDQSALLLAGAQSISMWMIPVVIAGIGIGVFVIKRRN